MLAIPRTVWLVPTNRVVTEQIYKHNSQKFQLRVLANSGWDGSGEFRLIDIEYGQVWPTRREFQERTTHFRCMCDDYVLQGREGLHRIYRNLARQGKLRQLEYLYVRQLGNIRADSR